METCVACGSSGHGGEGGAGGAALGILLVPVLIPLWEAWLIQQNLGVPEGAAGSHFTLYSFSWGGPLAYTLLPAACLRWLANREATVQFGLGSVVLHLSH